MHTEPLSVGELTRYLDELFSSDEVLSDLWIEGEVVEAIVSRAGHCYFTMADADTSGSSPAVPIASAGNAIERAPCC